MGILDRDFEATQTEAKALYKWLTDTHDDPERIKSFAFLAGIDSSTIYFAQAPELAWRDLLITAGKQRKLRALVEEVKEDPNSADATGQALMAGLLAEPVTPEDAVVDLMKDVAQAVMAFADEAFDAGLLRKDLPFIDRVELRGHLRLMTGPAQRRALLVSGESGMGKTWTREFISYLVDEGGLPKPKSIDLSMRAGAPIDERELATIIANTLLDKESPTFDPTAQAETVVTRFRTWLGGAVEGIKTPIWLILDGFTPTTATAGAIQLVNELAQAAALRDLGPVRIVVLGYRGNLAAAGSALCEPLHSPTRDDLRTFFSRAAVELQGVAPDDDALDELVDNFDATVGPIEATPMATLGPSARQHAYTLFEV